LPNDISAQFFRTLDRRQQQRRLTVVGSMAIAALAVGLISQLFLRENSLIPQVAQHHLAPMTAEPDSLVLALNHPPIDIPADAKSTDK
jgi:predicted Na+-dependent transporter